MLMRVDHGSHVPLSEQIATAVRGAFLRGEVVPGQRLPSARALAESVDVNLHTVLRAYAALRDEGLIELRRGRGAVIRNDTNPARTALAEAAKAFVHEARRHGLDTETMLETIRETATS
ncbi:MAG: GntR family transcriptional regulator [Rhodococcus sp.]|nr:GntR family transcriptional regulator [Rhodococcus sp. (in: high G+C Gram-positive bacteria)]